MPRPPRAGHKPTVDETVTAMLRLSGWSPSTVRIARGYLEGTRWRGFLRAHGVELVADLNDEHAAEFLAGLRDTGVSPATLVKWRQHLRALDEFCARTPGYASGLRATRELPRPRVPIRERDVLSREDENKLVAKAGPRDRLIVETLVGTGLRAGELVSLRLEDCRLDVRPYHFVVRRSGSRDQTKSGRDRITHVSNALAKGLRKYIATRKDTPRREVFLASRSDARGVRQPLTVNALESIFERLEETSGVRVRPHLLRHTWATRAADAGIPLPQLQLAGGWASLAIVSRYYSPDNRKMLESFEALE